MTAELATRRPEIMERRPFGRLFPQLPSVLDEFNDFMRFEWPLRRGWNGDGWTPRVDLIEHTETYEVRAEVPGCKPDDIKVNLAGNSLTIQGEKRRDKERKEDNVHVYERTYGAFQRVFSLADAVDEDSVSAELKDGVLTVSVKKLQPAQSREVKIKVKK